MERKKRFKLDSSQLWDSIVERINKLIDDGKLEICVSAIFENLGYEKLSQDGNCCIYTKDIKDFTIIFRFFLDNSQMDWSIPLPDGCITADIDFNELNGCVNLAIDDLEWFSRFANDMERFNRDYGKNI